jgi:tRNA pseudouridine55 synthase
VKKDVSEYNFPNGEILLVNKPYRWSSFDVVRKLKRLVKAKIGHAGTLDPLATGLMILATGPFTKRISEFQDQPKEYTGTFKIGTTTPSFDRETQETGETDISDTSEKQIREAAAEFVGTSMQTPPIFSAVKVDGMRAYKHARKGREAKIEAKSIEITDFEITRIELPLVHFRIRCSKGTYIRTIADDLGKKLGVGAYLYNLCRTRIGDHSLDDAWDINELVSKLRELEQTKSEGDENT